MDTKFFDDFQNVYLKHFYDDLFEISDNELHGGTYDQIANEFEYDNYNWEVNYGISLRIEESSGIKMF